MMNNSYQVRYFTSYSGVKLPLKLVGEIASDDMANRNTYFEGSFNEQAQICICRKIVYAETDLEHHYFYHDNGQLKQAIIIEDEDDQTTLIFDENGQMIV